MKILDTAQIRAKITGIKQSAATQRTNIHVALVHVVGHALRHGSSPLATLLLAAAGSGVNQKAIGAWLEAYGPFSADMSSKEVQFSKARRKAIDAAQDDIPAIEKLLDELGSGPQWWETKAKQDKAAEAFEVMAKLDSLIKSASAAVADDDKEVKDAELVRYLKAVRVKYISDMALVEAQRAARASEPQKMELDGKLPEVEGPPCPAELPLPEAVH